MLAFLAFEVIDLPLCFITSPVGVASGVPFIDLMNDQIFFVIRGVDGIFYDISPFLLFGFLDLLSRNLALFYPFTAVGFNFSSEVVSLFDGCTYWRGKPNPGLSSWFDLANMLQTSVCQDLDELGDLLLEGAFQRVRS